MGRRAANVLGSPRDGGSLPEMSVSAHTHSGPFYGLGVLSDSSRPWGACRFRSGPSTGGDMDVHDGSDGFRRDGAHDRHGCDTGGSRISGHIYQVIVPRAADEVVVDTLSDSVGMLDTSLRSRSRVAMP